MNEYYKFENTPLPYPYDAMEPYIDAETMHLHHDKHLQSYIDHLNEALRDYPLLQRLSLEELVLYADRLPPQVQAPVQHNAGGVYNHRFYFDGLRSPDTRSATPSGALADAITACFGSFAQFETEFKAAALSVFGSGYAWLTADKCGGLHIITTANQGTPLTEGLCPILNLDVWEHAYYLKYQNRRGDYIDGWFHVADWDRADRNYEACRALGGKTCR